MTLLTLSKKERAGLAEHLGHTHNAKELRRAQALLWLESGEEVEAVATRLHVRGRTLYRWVRRFEVCTPLSLGERLADGARSGRPRTAYGSIAPLIAAVIEEDPRALGYRATVGTAPLLQYYLEEVHPITVGRHSVSLASGRLRLRWKRPRHHLARRAPTWRQAKGGSNMGSGNASARGS
jgi:transposase